MPNPLTLTLTSDQQTELEQMRDHDPHPYLRERAAALLKIAHGQSGRHVALHGLLKVRDPDSVYGWIARYQAEGLEGLHIRPGRGRKSGFSPSDA